MECRLHSIFLELFLLEYNYYMKEIPLYQCEYCRKESRVKEVIRKHEIECKESYLRKQLAKENKKKWDREFLDTFDPNRIDECINNYIEKVHGLTFNNIRWSVTYSPNVSNSHGHPINGVDNFSRDDNKPIGYPGFHGRIRGDYSQDKTLSDFYMKIPGLHTGTGGGNGKDWQYAFYFFLQDFPNLEKEFDEKYVVEQAKANLSGDYNYIIREVYTNE